MKKLVKWVKGYFLWYNLILALALFGKCLSYADAMKEKKQKKTRDGERTITMLPVWALVMVFLLVQPAAAIDPPYQQEMQRLVAVMGNLYFLQPLCGFNDENWRQDASELIDLDMPDQDRKQRLNGAFNQGYKAYWRLYRTCTPSGRQAMARLLGEADHLARDIHARYAE